MILHKLLVFDREMIEATLAYQSRYYDMKPQLVSVSQNGKTVSQQNTHLQVHPAFMPQEDGITFQLTPVFLDTVPGESPDFPIGLIYLSEHLLVMPENPLSCR